MKSLYSFIAYGNSAIKLTHNKTIEFTKDEHITERASCIAGVGLKINSKSRNYIFKPITAKISIKDEHLFINGFLNPNWNFQQKSIIFRKSSNAFSDTLMVYANISADDISRNFLEKAKEANTEILIEIFESQLSKNTITRIQISPNNLSILDDSFFENKTIIFEGSNKPKFLENNKFKFKINTINYLKESNLNKNTVLLFEKNITSNLREKFILENITIFQPVNFFENSLTTLATSSEEITNQLDNTSNVAKFILTNVVNKSKTSNKKNKGFYTKNDNNFMAYPITEKDEDYIKTSNSLGLFFADNTINKLPAVIQNIILNMLKENISTKQITTILQNQISLNKNELYKQINILKANLD